MKPFLAALGGFLVALATFSGGALVAFIVLTGEPERVLSADEETAAVWTSTPREVDVAAQAFERVPGIAEAEAADKPASAAGRGKPAERGDAPIDTMTTASLAPPDEEEAAQPGAGDAKQAALIAAHVDWCFDRYRSYDPDTNTYQPYRGGRRDCVSPHLEELEALAAGATSAALGPEAGEAEDEAGEFATLVDRPATVSDDGGVAALHVGDGGGRPAGLSAAHVRDCFSRYRSYDPQTNTYQPFGGGPRRQCE